MNKIKSFMKILFSNNAIIKHRKINFFVILLLFFINVSLISVPFIVGKINSIKIVDELIDIENTIHLVYDQEIDCEVINSEMICSENYNQKIGSYMFVYNETYQDNNISESTIYLTKDNIYIIYVNQNDFSTIISGNYELLEGFNFSNINNSIPDLMTKDEYYEEVDYLLFTSIYYSSIDEQIALIYISQVVQVFIYLIIVVLLFQLMNLQTSVKKINILVANNIVVMSITGPALLVSIIGWYFEEFASLLFFLIFSIRILMIYYKLNYSSSEYI